MSFVLKGWPEGQLGREDLDVRPARIAGWAGRDQPSVAVWNRGVPLREGWSLRLSTWKGLGSSNYWPSAWGEFWRRRTTTQRLPRLSRVACRSVLGLGRRDRLCQPKLRWSGCQAWRFPAFCGERFPIFRGCLCFL